MSPLAPSGRACFSARSCQAAKSREVCLDSAGMLGAMLSKLFWNKLFTEDLYESNSRPCAPL